MLTYLLNISISIIFMFLIIFLPQKLNKDCKTESCFREKYFVKDAVATMVKFESRGRNTVAKYEYNYQGKSYFYFKMPFEGFDELGDQYSVIFDSINPDKSFLLIDKPIKPKDLIVITGVLTYYNFDKNEELVEVAFMYRIGNRKFERLQFFSLNYSELLKELYENKSEVQLEVCMSNANRAFLNIDLPLINERE